MRIPVFMLAFVLILLAIIGSASAATVNVDVGDLWFCSPVDSACKATTDNNDIDSVVSAAVGDTVNWNWVGQATHAVTACSGSDFATCGAAQGFASATQASGSFSQSFSQAGTFYYQCEIHTSLMRGQINVSAVAAPPAAPVAPGPAGAPQTGGTVGSQGSSFSYEILAVVLGGMLLVGLGGYALKAQRH